MEQRKAMPECNVPPMTFGSLPANSSRSTRLMKRWFKKKSDPTLERYGCPGWIALNPHLLKQRWRGPMQAGCSAAANAAYILSASATCYPRCNFCNAPIQVLSGDQSKLCPQHH